MLQDAPANSYIWGVQEFNTSLQMNDGSPVTLPVQGFEGLMDPTTGTFAAGTWLDQKNQNGLSGQTGFADRFFPGHIGDVTFYCAPTTNVFTCGPGPAVHDGTFPVFGIGFSATAVTSSVFPFVGMSDATTFASDNHPPTITQDTIAPPLPTGWVKSVTATTTLAATDLGLGMSQLTVAGPGLTGTLTATNGCTGLIASPCPVAPTPYTSAISWQTSTATPDGINTITDTATDIVGNPTQATHQIKIDQTPPVIGTLGGTLAAAITATGPLTLPIYGLTVPVTDATSGVQSITPSIDCPGVTLPATTQTNPADGAPLTGQFTLNATACKAGTHTITLTAADRAGNTAQTVVTVDLEPQIGNQSGFQYESQRLDDRMGLSENIGTGGLTLSANDIQIAGTAGLNLAVTRTYNAMAVPTPLAQSTTDARDLSPGWRLSIGPDVHLNTTPATTGLPAGAVRYYGPSGETYVFLSDPNHPGAFIDAPGLPAHLVPNADGSFTLAFFLSNSSLTFAKPASATAPAPLTKQTDRNGNQITVNYAPGTCGTALGCEVSTIQGTQGQALTFTYNPAGLLSQIADATGRKWMYNYDANANLNLYTDPNGGQTAYHYDPNTALLTNITDPNANTTNIVYASDGSHRTATVTEPDGTPNGQTTGFAYQNNRSETDLKNANGFTTVYQLDPLGRVLSTTAPDGFQTSTAWTMQAGTTMPSLARTNALASDPGSGAKTATSYFAENDYRPATSTVQSGSRNVCSYPGSGVNMFVPSSCTDDLGHVLRYTYDPVNNLKTITGAVNGQDQTPVNLSYNPEGTLAQSIDGNGNATAYTYNALKQLIKTSPPLPLGSTTVTYDPAGRVATATDGAGRTTSYTYDPLDRVLTQTSTGGGPTGALTVTYTYDRNGNPLTTTDPAGQTVDTPDAANRLTSERRPDGTTARYTYDAENNLKTLNDGVNDAEAFAYDTADRLSTVTATTLAGLQQSWTYTHQAPTTTVNNVTTSLLTSSTVTAPNGVTEASTLTAGQLTDLKYTGNAGTLRDFNYNYTIQGSPGATSGLIQSRGIQDGTSTTYAYDTFNRLTDATDTRAGSQIASYHYAYDPASNRRSQTINGTTTTYGYNLANELSSATQGANVRSFGYDASGNQISDSTGYTSGYTQLNQTTSFTGTNLGNILTPLNPTYRGAGQASRATVNGNVTETDSILGTTSLNNTSLLALGLGGNDNTTPGQTQVIRDPGGNLLGLSVTTKTLGLLFPTTTNYTYATDAEGSVSTVLDPSQSASDSYAYDPYGNTTAAVEIVPQPYRFQGEYQDSSGLYHIGQRYYDPTIGRWLQRDSRPQLGDPAWNPYGFALSNPINETDPSGELTNSCPLLALVCHFDLTRSQTAALNRYFVRHDIYTAAALATAGFVGCLPIGFIIANVPGAIVAGAICSILASVGGQVLLDAVRDAAHAHGCLSVRYPSPGPFGVVGVLSDPSGLLPATDRGPGCHKFS